MILSIAIRNGLMATAHAQDSQKLDTTKATTNHTIIGDPGSTIVGLDFATTDPIAAQAGILGDEFMDLALFDGFITSKHQKMVWHRVVPF